jgi:kynureninase
VNATAGWSATARCAQALDAADPLARFRADFALPQAASGEALTYLCGHSLGLAPHAARTRVLEELEDWERLGVRGHEHARRGWIGYAEHLQAPLAVLAGAHPAEVVAMNSLSINLHLLMASFYRPNAQRHLVLIEAGAFPSDRHIVTSQLRWHGYDPAAALIELAAREGEETLRPEDIEAAIDEHADGLALVLWPGVQYRTGQAFDLARVARSARRAGAQVGFDLAHSIGNVPLALHDSDADFAAWCSYKYLNGGPGAIGGAFVHARHAQQPTLPRLSGWWSHEAATRFQMGSALQLAPGAAGWQVSNPPVFSAAPLLASLELFATAGMPALRAKSLQLTAYLEFCLAALCGREIEVLTGADPRQRGCQLSIRVRGGGERARRVHTALDAGGVITDWREPDTIRLAPVPLYNRHADALHAAQQLALALRAQDQA